MGEDWHERCLKREGNGKAALPTVQGSSICGGERKPMNTKDLLAHLRSSVRWTNHTLMYLILDEVKGFYEKQIGRSSLKRIHDQRSRRVPSTVPFFCSSLSVSILDVKRRYVVLYMCHYPWVVQDIGHSPYRVCFVVHGGTQLVIGNVMSSASPLDT